MPRSLHPALRAATALIAATVLTLAGTQAASADTAPKAGTPATVSTDALPTAQMNGVAWAQVIVGNTVYVGGSFTKARPAGSPLGSNEVARSNMLAYDLTTGALTAFAPSFNGQVRGLAVSSDRKTIYAVGDFTTVGGATHRHVAAISVATGAAVASFAPSTNAGAYAVATSGSTVWVGGTFTSANSTTRSRAAAFSTSNGALTAWAPTIDADVLAMTVSPNGSQIVLGGRFATVDGTQQRGVVRLDTTKGTTAETWALNALFSDYGPDSAIWSLTSDSSYVYGTGYTYKATNSGKKIEGVFAANWADGSIHWLEDCHGDSYSAVATASVVYTASHAHDCSNVGGFPDSSGGDVAARIHQRALAFTVATTGTLAAEPSGSGYSNFVGQPSPTLLTWYPDFNIGTYTGMDQGPWNVTASGSYVVYGGEFTQVNGTAQQGLVRFATSDIAPDKDGPRLSGTSFEPTLTALGGGKVQVSFVADYDRDNQYLTYTLLRNGRTVATFTVGSRIWYDRPVTTWVNSGLAAGTTYTYQLQAADPFGNTAAGAAVTVTAK